MAYNAPPEGRNNFDVPLVHKACEFYKKVYSFSPKIPKRDKFGIWLKIENLILEIADLSISASFELRNNKLPLLNSVRVKIETLKRLVRISYEMKIIENKYYIDFETDLQEISKMTNGWIKYLQ